MIEHRCRAMHRISIGKYRPYDGVFIVNIIPFLPFCITKHLIQYSITTTDKQHNNDASNTVQSNEVSIQGNGIYINRMNYFTCTSDRRNSCINSSIFVLQDIDYDVNDNVMKFQNVETNRIMLRYPLHSIFMQSFSIGL